VVPEGGLPNMSSDERMRMMRMMKVLPSAEANELNGILMSAARQGALSGAQQARVDTLLAKAALLEAARADRLDAERRAALNRARLEARALEEERSRRIESSKSSGVPKQRQLVLVPPETKEEADLHVVTKLLGNINDAAVRDSHAYFQLQQQFRDDSLGLTLKGGGGTTDDRDKGGADGESCAGDDPHCLDSIK
jgi:hypothetical protein